MQIFLKSKNVVNVEDQSLEYYDLCKESDKTLIQTELKKQKP